MRERPEEELIKQLNYAEGLERKLEEAQRELHALRKLCGEAAEWFTGDEYCTDCEGECLECALLETCGLSEGSFCRKLKAASEANND